MRILVVEDDKRIAAFLERGLRENCHAVDVAGDGDEGAYLAQIHDYDLILLDILLPRKSGWDVCRELRDSGLQTPILMLTARDSVSDRVRGLDAGADDYLTKPFAFEELLARIRALSRRPVRIGPDLLQVADLELSISRQKVSRAGNPIELTPREFALLELFMSRAGEVLSRSTISERVWDQNFDGMSNVVDVYIKRLRDKIDRGFEHSLLRTLRGRGYVMESSDS